MPYELMTYKLAHKQQGFTLLEVLIALSLFAVLSAMAFGGLNQLLSQHQQLQKKQQRFVDLQSTIQVLERDFTHIQPRSTRDTYGDAQAALTGNSTPGFMYQVQGQKLWRSYFPQLDAGIGNSPVRYTLMDQVTNFKVRFLPNKKQWINYWPPIDQQGKPNLKELPKAIEIELSTIDLGTVKRLIAIPQSGAQQ
jgi:general secretion pathway protein J